MIYVHPIVLYTEPETPGRYVTDTLIRLLSKVPQFWEQGNYKVGVGALKYRDHQGRIDLSLTNPWQAVLRECQSLGYDSEDKFLVFLSGWDTAEIGWGADPLAVVGEYALQRVLSPDAWDDEAAAGLLNHEIGHVLGFGHTTQPAPNVMWEWWSFPNIYLPKLLSRLAGVQGTLVSGPCPKPP